MWMFYLGLGPVLRLALVFLVCGVVTGALIVWMKQR
jgi:hypothetical protein